MGVSGNLSARTCKRKISKKIKLYGDTDVTLQFKEHDQNLQVCLKWETKIMLKQRFSHQNKEKHLKRWKQNFIAVSFWIRRYFFCSYIIALQLRFSLEFPKNRQWI